jgi:ACT domain-containing protein
MKKAVTESDVKTQSGNGTFVVTRDMVLTPGAREYASRNNIALRYEHEAPRAAATPMSDTDIARIVEQIVISQVNQSSPTPPAPTAPRVPEAAALDGIMGQALDSQGRDAVLNCSDAQDGNRAIVTVVGQNQPGVVARISAVVAECGGDLADMSQVIIDQFFSMIFIVNLSGMEAGGISFRIFKERLQDEALRIGKTQVLVMHEGIFQAMHKV